MNDTTDTGYRYYVSYSGVKLPLKLVNPIEESELDNRNTYFRGQYNEQDQILSCQKVVYGEVEFEHRYSYRDNGLLERAEVMTAGEDTRIVLYDEKGRPLQD